MDYFIKIGIFSLYMGALSFITSALVDKLSFYIDAIPYGNWLCQFGIFTGLSLYLSTVVSFFLARKSIDFWR